MESMSFEEILLYVVTPALVVISLIEAVVLSGKRSHDFKATALSLLDLLARNALMVLLPLSVAAPVFEWAYYNRLATLEMSLGYALLLFLGQEFCYYWSHRAAHRIRWFWCDHAVHHSSNELNLAASFRQGLMGNITGAAVFFVPLIWLGFPPGMVALVLALNALHQFWIHATWIPKLGWLEYVLNTPSSHRVHHAANLDYLDANYGGVLIVFDRLFGTYRAEDAAQPCRYGWVTPLASYNPLVVEFSQWAALVRDLKSARSTGSVRAALGYLAMPPGWSPTGEGDTTEALRRSAASQIGLRPK
jgi:sterol desaturase/sphingolipid hydroxylase (fatty acid hydroxylase superfamily)